MYICIYVWYVRHPRTYFIDSSSVRRARGQGRPHAIYCADQRHPRSASGPHAIFCAERSAHKKELSTACSASLSKHRSIIDSRHTFRIYAYSNLANCKFTLVQYTVLQCQPECQASKKPGFNRKIVHQRQHGRSKTRREISQQQHAGSKISL